MRSPIVFGLQVYILGRMGASSKALDIIVGDQRDVPAAIAFLQVMCKTKDSSMCVHWVMTWGILILTAAPHFALLLPGASDTYRFRLGAPSCPRMHTSRLMTDLLYTSHLAESAEGK
jgi:hypothetical protein